MHLTLRRLTADDFPQLLLWLHEPHVKRWWDDGDDTLEKVARHYSNQSTTKERFLLLLNNDEDAPQLAQPIGYMQYELDDNRIASIDQFIGISNMTNRGLGTQAIKLLIEYVTTRHQPRMITVDPHPDNHRAIRCYEKVGFQHDPALPQPEVVEAYMMKYMP